METISKENQNQSKVCSKCHELKPLTEFHKMKGSPDGYQYMCIKCKKEENNKRKLRAKEHTNTSENNKELSKFTSGQLIKELKIRGYKGELTIEQKIRL